MYFQWDEAKARSNEQKHGVSFAEAAKLFADDHSSCVHDPDHSHDEDRSLLFGVTSSGSLLVVAYTERSETLRIISVRSMTSQERKADER